MSFIFFNKIWSPHFMRRHDAYGLMSGSWSLIHTPISAKGKMIVYSKFFNHHCNRNCDFFVLESGVAFISHNDKVAFIHIRKQTVYFLLEQWIASAIYFFTNLLLSQFCGLVINIIFVASNCALISISVFSAQ